MNDVATWAAIASALLAAAALIGTFLNWRLKELRRDNVLAWSTDAITALQSLVIICSYVVDTKSHSQSRLEDICYSTAILIQRGRLFFGNVQKTKYGLDKEPAYRGYRPLILDQLLIAHQIAIKWSKASEEDRAKMKIIAERSLKKFVSMVQKEVGRARTGSADTKREGNRVILEDMMRRLDFE